MPNFVLYDGKTGQSVLVTEFIDDGKQDIIADPDELAIIRLMGEGGIDPEEKHIVKIRILQAQTIQDNPGSIVRDEFGKRVGAV